LIWAQKGRSAIYYENSNKGSVDYLLFAFVSV
jgi:hypothetical protein